MELGLRDKRVLITGASAGIGAAAAHRFAAEGADLVLVARTEANLVRTRDRIRAAAGASVRVEIAVADVTRPAALDALAKSNPDIDVLVNNAGATPAGTLLDVPDADWRAGWDSKVFAYLDLCRRFYPLMRDRGGGVIVNVLGNGSLMKRPDYLCGGMANAALDFLTTTLGGSSPADNIRVVGISPGPVDTERYRRIAEKRVAGGAPERAYPFDRLAKPDEIGALITLLASERAGYVSGTILVVDGGMSVSREHMRTPTSTGSTNGTR